MKNLAKIASSPINSRFPSFKSASLASHSANLSQPPARQCKSSPPRATPPSPSKTPKTPKILPNLVEIASPEPYPPRLAKALGWIDLPPHSYN